MPVIGTIGQRNTFLSRRIRCETIDHRSVAITSCQNQDAAADCRLPALRLWEIVGGWAIKIYDRLLGRRWLSIRALTIALIFSGCATVVAMFTGFQFVQRGLPDDADLYFLGIPLFFTVSFPFHLVTARITSVI